MENTIIANDNALYTQALDRIEKELDFIYTIYRNTPEFTKKLDRIEGMITMAVTLLGVEEHIFRSDVFDRQEALEDSYADLDNFN